MRLSLPLLAIAVCSLVPLAGCSSPERGGKGEGGGSGIPHVSEIELEDAAAYATEPRFSPDGATIAFIHFTMTDTESLAVMDLFGGQLSILAPAGTYLAAPAWSPDGAQIYFSSYDGISVAPAAGGAASVPISDFATIDPDISPDGKSIVYATNGGKLKLVDLADPSSPKILSESGTSPRFSPDGLSIAFESSGHIKIMTLSTGEVKDLLDATTYLASVDWLPDGKSLAITANETIELVTLEPTVERTVLQEEFAATNIDVSADGKAIAYSVNGLKSVFILRGF